MVFLKIILIIFITLILVSMINTLLRFSLKLVTRKNYMENILILPSFLTLLIWFLSYNLIIKIFTSLSNISVYDAIFGYYLKTVDFSVLFPNLLLMVIIIIALSLILQSIALLTVNIDYMKLYNKLKFYIKRKDLKNNTENELEPLSKSDKLNFINSFICNFFIFSLIFFLSILLFWIGTSIAYSII